MANDDDQRPHLILHDSSTTEHFTSPSSGGGTPLNIPLRNRAQQYAILQAQLTSAKRVAEQSAQQAAEAAMDIEGIGITLEFESYPDVDFTVKSLSQDTARIELLNVRYEGNKTFATVWVPHGKLSHFERVISEYFEEKKDRNQQPRDNRKLVDAIAAIRIATIDALWTDTREVWPQDPAQSIWWEAWLPVRSDRNKILSDFRRFAEAVGARLGSDVLEFPERTVVLLFASRNQLQASAWLLGTMAELRRAKDTAEFFDQLAPEEQTDWVSDLVQRTASAGANAPHVCLLDTGTNRSHPLLEHSLSSADVHTVEPAWGTDDHVGHGTGLAGLALYGDLQHALASDQPITLSSRLETVKLVRYTGDNEGKHYGKLTIEATARPEITAPSRSRVFSMAVTATDGRDRGRPSAWSSAIDRLAADADGDGEVPRLFIVSAGNLVDQQTWREYPAHLATDGIHDPAQAWNALTIGACTEKIWISEPDAKAYAAIAPCGGLSPFTTTSAKWTSSDWPWKPDLVLEGGNAGKDDLFACTFASLSLLTTHHNFSDRLLAVTNATSAASALAANMAARIMAQYPDFWPETVRALLVHSARWTPEMLQLHHIGGTHTEQMTNLLRHCGYGVPDLRRALWSASNSLALIIEDSLQPFEKTKDGIKTRDMHIHDLPWPVEILESLGGTLVKMRVTLSYFIEPNPGERQVASKFSYQSHGLRFDVRRPRESIAQFRHRINRAARDEEEGTRRAVADGGWTLGDNLRRRGSLHSDEWEGTASELAQRGALAIYPAMGWWKTRTKLQRSEKLARYALIVSIEAPEVTQDIYAAVETIAQQIEVLT